MSQAPLPWTGPKPASDEDLARHKLPVDIQIGTVIFRAGVPLLDFVKAMRSYQQRAWPEQPEAT